MGNNKVKTAGQLQGKKGNGQKNLHPNSRRLKQAVRVDLRTRRVEMSKKTKQHVDSEQISRLLWFVQELQVIDPDRTHLSVHEMHELAVRFLTRLDDELDEERKTRRAGRPMSKRQEELEAAKSRDQFEYDHEGLLMPDLSDKTSVISLRYWLDKLEGASGYQKRLRLVRLWKNKDEMTVVQSGEKPPETAYHGIPRDGDEAAQSQQAGPRGEGEEMEDE